jgi:hypothetical protein
MIDNPAPTPRVGASSRGSRSSRPRSRALASPPARARHEGRLPGVVLVPAMLIAFTSMEEKGIAYVYAG